MNKIDKEITKVVFRKWSNGTIDAYMPELIVDGEACTSYTRIGQHSAAAYAYCISKTKAASPSEYATLLKELTGLGYNVKVIKKYIRKK